MVALIVFIFLLPVIGGIFFHFGVEYANHSVEIDPLDQSDLGSDPLRSVDHGEDPEDIV